MAHDRNVHFAMGTEEERRGRRAARRGQGGRLTTLNFRTGAVTTLNFFHVLIFLMKSYFP